MKNWDVEVIFCDRICEHSLSVDTEKMKIVIFRSVHWHKTATLVFNFVLKKYLILYCPSCGIEDLNMVDNLKALSVNVMSSTNNCILKEKWMTYTLLKDIQYRDSVLILTLSGMRFSLLLVDKIAENNWDL